MDNVHREASVRGGHKSSNASGECQETGWPSAGGGTDTQGSEGLCCGRH